MQKVSSGRRIKPARIVIVGPVSPYRGGIAQYNTQLHDAMQGICQVSVVSFKRLYPGFLYPGSSDKEPDSDQTRRITADEIIDAYWPPSLKKAVSKITQDKPETVIITWWTLFWQPGLAYVARKLQKKGIRVVYVCHNVFDHDANRLVRFFSKRFLAGADGYIVHSSDEAARLKNLYPDANILNTTTLPVSDDFPEPSKALPTDNKLELLFFGFVRPYKGVDVLLDAMTLLPKRHNIHLTIVGEVWSGKELLEAKAAAIGNETVELNSKYVSAQAAANYFGRADVVVLPYKSATGSAVASQAYFYQKPILGTSVSGIKDVVGEGKTGWLVQPGSAKALAKAITQLNRKAIQRTHAHIREFNSRHGWDAAATTYLKFLREL